MTTISREFQVFGKPVGPTCNLNCRYCYYLGKKNLYPDTDHFLMADDILEKYIIQYIHASTESNINFSWHGGEPLLAGIDFFRKIIKLQRIHKPAGSKIVNGIQTNGTLLSDKWSSFLAAEGFIVGISIDGPGDMHNNNRRTKGNGISLPKVIEGYELLLKHGVIPEILCVVNADNVKYPLIIYNFFKQLGAKYITFLPLVEPQPGFPNGASSISVSAEGFGFFLSAIFDEWVEKDIGTLKIQIFEEAARTAFNQEHTLCIFKINCGGVPVLEHNGDFYSCDHFVDNGHMLGNIRDHSLSYYLDSESQIAFGQNKSLSLPHYCVECEVRPMCNGECPKNRFITTPEGEMGLNYLCSGYKYFFNHCRPFVDAISTAWKNQ
ncbi:MAG: anaerobic sulfatase maturase [Bacteroidia bacterium]|nr:anaerobic sulfatase maturase [Bacteroidia bacterium]